jgi:hypothetical protein
VVTGEVNGDGSPDLIVANFANNTVGVSLGNGDGTFQEQQTFATQLGPRAVALGDFNGDGILDVVVANFESNTVSVLLGNDNGTFQAQDAFATGIEPVALAAVDVNGDGKPDIVVANSFYGGAVSVLLGNGNGTFQAQQPFAGYGPKSVTVSDLLGDGKPDIVVANPNSDTVGVYLGNGDGTFQAQQAFAVGADPQSVAVLDVNGDSMPDLAIANTGSNTVSVLLGNGNGTFQAQQVFAAGTGPVSVAMDDVNGDGHPNLITANARGNNASVLLGNGNGTFQAMQNFAAGSYPDSVAVVDFNGDGRPDEAVANLNSNTVSVLLNSGNGAFTGQVYNVLSPATHFVITGFPGNVTASGGFTFTITAEDANNNLAAGYTRTVHFTSSDSFGELPADATLASGVGTFSATLVTAGTQTLIATDLTNNSITGVSGPINVVAAPASHFVFSGTPATATADTAFVFTVTAEDRFNNTATSYGGTVQFTSSDGKAVLPANSTLTAGVGAFTATLVNAGSQTLTAADLTTGSISGRSTSITVIGQPATHFVLNNPFGSTTAGSTITFTVTAEDAFNNIATSYGGTVHFTSSDSKAVLPTNSTLIAGVATFHATLVTAGTQTLTAADLTNSSITSASTAITVSAAAASHFVVSGTIGSATAGAPIAFTVTAEDPFNNVASAYSGAVRFASSDSKATLPANSTLTDGIGAFSATLITIGSQTITATDTVNNTITGFSNPIAVSAAALTHFVLTVPGSAVAGSAFGFTVAAEDRFNNPVSTYSGTVSYSASDANTNIKLPSNAMLTNGVGKFSATLATAGNQTIFATDTIASTLTVASNSILVSAASATHLRLTSQTTTTAGSAFTLTVTALDQFNNTATGYLGTVKFTTSDTNSQHQIPAPYSFISSDNGQHVFTFGVTLITSANAQTVTGTDEFSSSVTAGTTSLITVVPLSANHFSVVAPFSATAGMPFTVTVTTFDRFGNKVPNYTGTVWLSVSGDTRATFVPSAETLTSGAGTFMATLFVATPGGTRTITAMDTSGFQGSSNTITVSTAATSQFVLGVPSTATAGSGFPFTVTAEDPYGNTVLNYGGAVEFTTSDQGASTMLPGIVSLTSGMGAFSATLSTLGAQTLTAADAANSTISGTGIVTVAPAIPPGVFLSISSSVASRGGTISVPININQLFDPTNGEGQIGLFGATLIVYYNSNVFQELGVSDVTLGAFPDDPSYSVANGWRVVYSPPPADVSQNIAVIGIVAPSTGGLTSTGGGSLVVLNFHVLPNAPLGDSYIDLAADENGPGSPFTNVSDGFDLVQHGDVEYTLQPDPNANAAPSISPANGPIDNIGDSQTITFGGTINAGSTFALGFAGATTSPVTYSANPITLQNEIQAALNINPNIGVAAPGVPDGLVVANSAASVTVTFQGGQGFANPQPLLTWSSSLTGTNASISVADSGLAYFGALSNDPAFFDPTDGVVNITGTNTAPTANNDTYSITERDFATDPSLAMPSGPFSLTANDTSPVGNPLSTSLVSGPSNGVVSINGDQTITFGSTETNGDLFQLLYANFTTAPIAYSTTAATLQSNTQAALNNLIASTPIVGLGTPVVAATSNTSVTVTFTSSTNLVEPAMAVFGATLTGSNPTLAVASQGSFVYTPNTGYLGADSFTYEDTDSGTGLVSNIATVNLNVTARLSIPTNLIGSLDGVALGPVQTLTFGGTINSASTFTLALNGATTAPITFPTGTNSAVVLQNGIQQALNNLSTVGAGNAVVDVPPTPGTGAVSAPAIITFVGGPALASGAPALMTVNSSSLTGTSPTITVGAAVPVNMDNENPAGSGGLFGAVLAIDYDSTVLRFASAMPGTIASAADEVQTLTFPGTITGGSFQLVFFSASNATSTTSPIQYSSDPATLQSNIQSALTNLAAIGSTGTSPNALVSFTGASTFRITFQNTLSSTFFNTMTVVNSSLGGIGPNPVVTTTTAGQAVGFFGDSTEPGQLVIEEDDSTFTGQVNTQGGSLVLLVFNVLNTALVSTSNILIVPFNMNTQSSHPAFTDLGFSNQNVNDWQARPGLAGYFVPGVDGILTITGATHFDISAPGTATAGSPITFTVIAEDPRNNTASGYTGTVAFTSSDSLVSFAANDVTLTSGVGTFTATLATAVSQTLTATDTTLGIFGTSNPIGVSGGPASHFVFTGTPAGTTAGQPFAFTVVAEDAFNNIATNYGGSVHFTSTDVRALFPAPTTLTAGIGNFSATLFSAGSQNLVATDLTTSSITGRMAGIVVIAAPASHLVFGPTPNSISAESGFMFTLMAEDPFNNIATGYSGTVQFTSTDSHATFGGNPRLTNGIGGFVADLVTAGTQTLTATDLVVSSITGASSRIVVHARAANHFAFSGIPNSTTAGAGTVFTVTAEDPLNNLVNSYAGSVAMSSTDTAAAFVPVSETFISGVGTFSVTLRTAGNQTLTATDTKTPSIIGASSTIAVNPAAVSHFVLSAVPSNITAGNTFNLTVTSLDAFNNLATGYTGTVVMSSTDTAASFVPPSATLTGAVGTFSVTLKTVGSWTVTAKDAATGTPSVTTGLINVFVAPASHFVISGTPGSTTAGHGFGFTVTAYDPFNNLATGYLGTVVFSSSDKALVFLPSAGTLAGGVGTFSATLKTAGNQTITAQDSATSTITGTSNTITVSAAAATHFALTGEPSSLSAGTPFAFTVTAEDAFNNKAIGYAGTVHFTSTDPNASVGGSASEGGLPSPATLTSGVGAFTATLVTAGSQTLTVSDAVAGSIAGSATVSIASLAANHFQVSVPSPVQAGQFNIFQVTALDRFNNQDTTYGGTVEFTTSAAKAQLSDPGALTNGMGNFVAILKSAGIQTVTATDIVNNTLTGTSNPITVTPAGLFQFAVTASNPTAGLGFAFTVVAQDQFGNTETNYGGTVRFSSTDGRGVLPANSTLAAGQGTFSATLATSGSQTLSATDTVSANVTGVAALILSPGPATHFAVTAAGSATAGVGLPFTVTAEDQFNNTASSYAGSVLFSSSDTQAGFPAPSALVSGTGVFVATLKTAGLQTVFATDTSASLITGSTGPISVVAAAAEGFSISPNLPVYPGITSGPNSFASTGLPTIFTVQAVDSFGNPAPGYSGTVQFASSDGAAVLPANGAITGGAGTFSATLMTVGNQTLSADDTVNNINGTSGQIITRGLVVTSFATTPSGFVIGFNKPLDPSTELMYTTGTTPDDIILATAGAQIGVRGTVLINAADTSITFVKTDNITASGTFNPAKGLLSAGNYTLTLRSLTDSGNGFQDSLGVSLDGTNSGGTNNYSITFSVGAPPVAVGIPDFARGPSNTDAVFLPSTLTNGSTFSLSYTNPAATPQTATATITFSTSMATLTSNIQTALSSGGLATQIGVNAGAGNTPNSQVVVTNDTSTGANVLVTFQSALATAVNELLSSTSPGVSIRLATINVANNIPGNGIPIALSSGLGVTSGTFTLQYNPSLLTISGAVSKVAGATFSLVSNNTVTGTAVLSLSSPSSISSNATAITLGSLIASVPFSVTASYGVSQLLHFSGEQLSGTAGPIAVTNADGVQVTAYLGDVTDSGGPLTQNDAMAISAVAQSVPNPMTQTIPGFAAFPNLDPSIIGGVSLQGAVSTTDSGAVLQEVGGVTRVTIPYAPIGLTVAPPVAEVVDGERWTVDGGRLAVNVEHRTSNIQPELLAANSPPSVQDLAALQATTSVQSPWVPHDVLASLGHNTVTGFLASPADLLHDPAADTDAEPDFLAAFFAGESRRKGF